MQCNWYGCARSHSPLPLVVVESWLEVRSTNKVNEVGRQTERSPELYLGTSNASARDQTSEKARGRTIDRHHF